MCQDVWTDVISAKCFKWLNPQREEEQTTSFEVLKLPHHCDYYQL